MSLSKLNEHWSDQDLQTMPLNLTLFDQVHHIISNYRISPKQISKTNIVLVYNNKKEHEVKKGKIGKTNR